mgnify:CR=1 FL=1
MNRRSFLAGLFAVAASTQVKAEDIQSLCERAQYNVNQKLRYATDMQVHGVIQKVETVAQAYARGFGDCEEFALCYRHELLLLGVDSERIKIVYCAVVDQGAHAICVVDDLIAICCYLPNSVRPLSRRPDLIPHPKIGYFLAYRGTTEAELVDSISRNRAVAAGF